MLISYSILATNFLFLIITLVNGFGKNSFVSVSAYKHMRHEISGFMRHENLFHSKLSFNFNTFLLSHDVPCHKIKLKDRCD